MTELRPGFVPDDPVSVDMVSDVVDSLRHIVGAYSQLQGRVIAFDRALFGDRVKSFGELGLRGQRFIIAMCMRDLRAELANVAGRVVCGEALRAALGDTFASFDDMAAFIVRELQRITSGWVPWRDLLVSQPPLASDPTRAYLEHKALYLVAIRAAQHEMNGLNHGKFGDVLRAGMNCRTWPAFRRACLRMRVAMQTHPVPELEISALVAATGAAMWRTELQRAQG